MHIVLIVVSIAVSLTFTLCKLPLRATITQCVWSEFWIEYMFCVRHANLVEGKCHLTHTNTAKNLSNEMFIALGQNSFIFLINNKDIRLSKRTKLHYLVLQVLHICIYYIYIRSVSLVVLNIANKLLWLRPEWFPVQ